MTSGILFLVVGASGVGKDTLIDAAMETLAATGRYVRARRVITRPAGPGERHEPASPEAFEQRRRAGGFLHHWEAHGLSYGLPATLRDHLATGRHVVANGSRAALPPLRAGVERLVVVEITADRETRRERITRRQREAEADVERRLARSVEPFPPDLDVVTVANDGTIAQGVERLVLAFETAASGVTVRRLPIRMGRANMAFLPADRQGAAATSYLDAGRIEIIGGGRSICADVAVLEAGSAVGADEIGLSAEAYDRLALPPGCAVVIRRTPVPASRALLRRKLAGGRLDADAYEIVFRDIVEDRYPESECAVFLVKTIETLDDEEVVAVARARTRFMPRLDWRVPMVVDKHSLGGIPGSRITPIVVPIVAAHGLRMPKTSSRAITSASGTAEVMEAACRVDLDPVEVRRVVDETNGCIVWNGRLNHSALDDVVNAITRPLGLDSNRWSVASILSKKWIAGSTHVVIDLPYGPRAKLKTRADADDLGRLFEEVGRGIGLIVRAFSTDGSRAIGRGIGPALELRDVERVLDGASDAPHDLRDKALRFAAELLAFDPTVGDPGHGRARAEALLDSGAARRTFDRIVTAQGRRPAAEPGAMTYAVRAPRRGTIVDIDGWHLAGVARQAGAPGDSGAGIDLAAEIGSSIEAGQTLYTIHATSEADLGTAIAAAAQEAGIVIANGDAVV